MAPKKVPFLLLAGMEITRQQPGVGGGHHLHPDGPRLTVPVAIMDWFSRYVVGLAAVQQEVSLDGRPPENCALAKLL